MSLGHIKRRKSSPEAHVEEIALFGAHFRDADLPRIDLERNRLAFERDKLSCDPEELIREREERQAE